MKTYYKFRPRKGETIISYDKMHPSGIIVDGHLEFPKEDGALFVATFESTSAATGQEVRYSLQKQQLKWDGLAASSVVASTIMLILWIYNVWSLAIAGWLFSILLVITLVGLTYLGFQMYFRTAGRYRYIYAIEQFKQYHADEQWVALGHDVFTESTDPNFLELKNQCVENGFGLVIVDKEEHVNLLITPAREEVFGKRRRSLKFMENPSLQNLRNFAPRNLERYKRPYMAQALMCLFSLVILSGIFYRQWQLRPVQTFFSELGYQDSMSRLANRLEPESGMYVYKKEDNPSKENQAQMNVDPLSRLDNPQDAQNNNVGANTVGLYVYTPTDGYLIYDCERANMRGTKYVVQDILYSTFEEASKRIDQLKTYGLIANCISLKCTQSTTAGYCVYYDLMYSSEKDANGKAIQIKKELADLHLPNAFIKLRVLQF